MVLAPPDDKIRNLMNFSEEQLHRYARNIILPEVGGEGQKKLLNSKVLVVGAGGLGAPVLLYLAAAGVGTIGIIDDDLVELSNLQRQIIHGSSRIDMAKVESSALAINELNPDVCVIQHPMRLRKENIKAIFNDYEIIADGSDNFGTRFLLADAAHLFRRTLVSAAISRFEGQISTFKSHKGSGFPCYRCLYNEAPPEEMVPNCVDGGVLGALAGVLGSIQAIEIIKEVLGFGETLAGKLLLYDALESTFRKVKLNRDPDCKLCGLNASIVDI